MLHVYSSGTRLVKWHTQLFPYFYLLCALAQFQVRRGADRAEIYSLAFSSSAQWLAVSSDKGTVHVFSLKVDSGSLGSDGSRGASEPSNASPSAVSHLSFIKGSQCVLHP